MELLEPHISFRSEIACSILKRALYTVRASIGVKVLSFFCFYWWKSHVCRVLVEGFVRANTAGECAIVEHPTTSVLPGGIFVECCLVNLPRQHPPKLPVWIRNQAETPGWSCSVRFSGLWLSGFCLFPGSLTLDYQVVCWFWHDGVTHKPVLYHNPDLNQNVAVFLLCTNTEVEHQWTASSTNRGTTVDHYLFTIGELIRLGKDTILEILVFLWREMIR